VQLLRMSMGTGKGMYYLVHGMAGRLAAEDNQPNLHDEAIISTCVPEEGMPTN
jgi:hypothetical protein